MVEFQLPSWKKIYYFYAVTLLQEVYLLVKMQIYVSV